MLPGPHDVQTGGLILVRPDEIHGDTHRARLGDVERLQRRLRHGEKMYHPAVVRDESGRLTILAGTRRLAARQRNDMQALIPVVECPTWSSFAQWMIADKLASEDHDSKPTSLLEAAALVDKVLRLLKPHYRDAVLPAVCAYLGVDDKQLGYVRSTIRRYIKADVPDEVRAYAQGQLDQADAGIIAAHTAYVRTKDHADGLDKSTLPAAEQRRRLQVGASTLAGVMAGFADLGAISPNLTDSEVSSYIEMLSASRLQLERTIKGLRAAQGERAQSE